MKNRGTSVIHGIFSSTVQSYSQIFFSNAAWFGVLLMLVSFLDVYAGIAGLLAVLITNLAAYLTGLNTHNIKQGFYGFNTLLVGLGIGIQFNPSVEVYILVAFASLLTFLLTVVFEGVIGKYGLPYLSISFLIAIWAVTLATRQYEHLELSQRGIFMHNEMYDTGGMLLVDLYLWFSNLGLPESVITYFRSLGAIFFQYHLFAGVLIAIGLLIYSRIAFILTLIGFFTAWWFYGFIGADLAQLNSTYVGFNFILTSIALGGFFLLASKHSYLWVLLSVPVITILISATSVVFSVYGLSIFSLPFNMVVLSVLYLMKFRERNFTKPQLVTHQHFSPEQNLYAQLNYSDRFTKLYYVQFELPVMGEWVVTQAHNGEHTHRDRWQHAWDFEIMDDEGSLYANKGFAKEHYYCYAKPVIAPADGTVVQIVDHIDDNAIGKVDLEHNWGNAIIIKHADGLYSNISHLLKDSFKVKEGDFVKKGDVLALCGNSGRSPQPHVHFQIQALPHIGSETIKYPLAYYVVKKDENVKFQFFDYPKNYQQVSNLSISPNLKEAFRFVPGQKLYFSSLNLNTKNEQNSELEVLVDFYGNPYIYDAQTKSTAFYRNDEKVFMFTSYYGPRKGTLYHLYLAFYRIPFSFYKGSKVNDVFPINFFSIKPLIVLQDIIAPFYIFLRTKFEALYFKHSEDFSKTTSYIHTQTSVNIGKMKMKSNQYQISIKNGNIEEVEVETKREKWIIRQVFKNRELK